MRVCMISEHASPLAALGGADAGGQNVYVAKLADELARMGHAVDVYTRREDPGVAEIVELAPGVRVLHVAAGPARPIPKEELLPLMGEFAADMTRLVEQAGGCDLVHAHFFLSGMVGVDLAERLGVPSVVTFHALGKVRRQHQQDADAFPDERFVIEEGIVARADRVIAECPQDERDLLELYDADPLRVTLVPCGYAPEEFAPEDKAAARAALGLPGGVPIVLQLGRMVRRKGIDLAIEGLAHVRRRLPDALLLIVGGASREPDPARDPELARLIEVAREAGVTDAVRFVGSRARHELARYFSAADLFVTAPWYEPFGITPLEAMACARPVVASDVGGLRYTVVDGVTGLRVPPRDPQALGTAMAELLADPSRAEAMGRAGHERVRERFTWRQVALQMEEVYRETLAKHRHARSARAQDEAGSAIAEGFAGLADTVARSRRLLARPLTEAATAIADTLAGGGKVLVCGNGGSAADSQHFAAEFVGRFRSDARRALPVMALCADPAFLTAWANDASFEDVFARGVRAYGRPGDVLLVLSTSGRSPNVLAAMREARAMGLVTIALLGGALGPALGLADLAIRVPSRDTARIQEVHTLALHLICEIVEARVLAHDETLEREHA